MISIINTRLKRRHELVSAALGNGASRTTVKCVGRRKALLLAAAAAVAIGATAPANAAEKSANLYIIPYAPGTKVKVTRDAVTHKPPTRIDMVGKGGKEPHRIVATGPGTVRVIQDGFSENRPGKSPCNNNYVWLQHENDEATKYSHMSKGSVTGAAGLRVGDTVEAGTFLGYEDDVGCATGSHLHTEVLGKTPDVAAAIDAEGFPIGGSAHNLVPRVCGIPKQTYVAGQTYVASGLVPGASEYARHGVPASKYQALFAEAANCGYRLSWIDGYTDDGHLRFNVVFRTNTPVRAWKSHSRLTGAQYQARFDEYKEDGFRLTHVDSYRLGGAVRYAAIFEKTGGPKLVAYHGLSAADHEQRLDDLTAQGFRPHIISPVSIDGQRQYTALYLMSPGGSWEARSFLTPKQYQGEVDDNTAKGRRLVYLNAYAHQGAPRLTAIWHADSVASLVARHGLTSAEYQKVWAANLASGRLTRAVTGYEDNGHARFAAFWTP